MQVSQKVAALALEIVESRAVKAAAHDVIR
jgi:hypothetical protein